MNLVLVEAGEVAGGHAVLTGRRADHVRTVHRAVPGSALTVGILGGAIGKGTVLSTTADAVELALDCRTPPPPPLPLTLLLALPRPKVLGRVIASATSLGIKRIVLMNSWRVEKSYWETPRLDPGYLRDQMILGLEQARDTVLPEITIARRFRPFVEDDAPAIAAGTTPLVAHPTAIAECPRNVAGPVTLAIGPEGGFIANEIALFERAGFRAVTLGPRILRVETVVPHLAGRIF